MISTRTLNKFNEIRALIFAGSHQVKQEDGFIVTLDEWGHIDSYSSRLVAPEAYDILQEFILHNPLSVELAEVSTGMCAIRDCKVPSRHFAYMLT